MIPAANITLCCIDTEHHALSAVALRQSAQMMQFGKIVFITNRSDYMDPGWELHRIKKFENYAEFNRFTLKTLFHHIETDYVLLVQFDGFVINPTAWTDDFLKYDYIGAPWLHVPCQEYSVGNGGFSLRSRKLLKALQDDRIILSAAESAEDLCICQDYRSYLECHYGINFPPPGVAARFSHEAGPDMAGTFGFHGLRRLVDLYVGETVPFLAENLQGYLLSKGEAVVLALQYVFRGQHEAAAVMFKRIAQYQSHEQARQHITIHGTPHIVDILDQSWARYVNPQLERSFAELGTA